MTRRSGPVPLRQTLERLLAGLGAPDIDSTTLVVERWPEVVGEELATHVRAVAVRGSELVVGVDDPAWASQVAWLEARLLERLDVLVGRGTITAVKVRVEPQNGP
ncbi:MAG: DUF721 domain-containing protein [Actinomycetota bacterium]|jgi:predicted nucleic acid-binding Zn ribbon protein|nr:DUF721 domain-containing protein [Actinomycetota bacterium]MEC8999632.1 DUF721 domain-containing protein [Actinomycetota bacterium]MED5232395.1 DUF721 domain-containing protein [Actinomycetota bacterium]MEE3353176.1 DUF721 domain-containing protein [Actinomycetota bacterium]